MFKVMVLLFIFSLVHAKTIDWQGHRGARGLYPENTINAMREALKYPITTLELDVVVTKDQKIIVSHEPWMNEEICLTPEGEKIKGKKISLYQLTYDEILKYDCGSKPHPRFPDQKKVSEYKPLLTDLISELEKEMKERGIVKNYSIEIKSTVEGEKQGFQPDYKKFSDSVLALVGKLLSTKRFMIQSFDWRVLKYIHKKYPEVSLVALKEETYNPREVLKELGFTPTVFSPNWRLLRPEHVKFFHEKGMKVIPWTVNKTEDIKGLLVMNVDGIITDYPNLISSIIHNCSKEENFFEGKCVKVPANAKPSESNPGWVCKYGHNQKRSSCVKIKVPAHAHLKKDGKTWVCNEGYKRYRHTCKKKN